MSNDDQGDLKVFAMPTLAGLAVGGTCGLAIVFYFLFVEQKFSHTGTIKIMWSLETLGAIIAFYVTALVKKAPSDVLSRFMTTPRGIMIAAIIMLSAPLVTFSLGALVRSAG